jgi:hypothetical protein
MLETIKTYAIGVLLLVCVALGAAVDHYHGAAAKAELALATQNAQVKAQNLVAAQTLKTLTEQRDSLQIDLNARAAAQKEADEKAQAQIAADSKRDAATPVAVRVRYVTRDAGNCGGGSPGSAAASAPTGGGDTDSASGVLAPTAAGLFKRDQDAVEMLQAAFNSCKTRLTPGEQ